MRWLPLVATLAGCGGSLPPLRGQIEVGRDAYAVFVAGNSPAGGDLYAVRAEGGAALPITFTNVGEMQPRLSPDGVSVLFLRGASLSDSMPASVWVMNLLSGAERELRLPKGAGLPTGTGWTDGGSAVIVATAGSLYRFGAPPARPDPHLVSPDGRVAAESSLAVLLGDPPFARVVPCAEPRALCLADSGQSVLAREARDALPWGPDSVAYFVGDAVEIRPLGGGRTRRLDWPEPLSRPRQMTAFLGSPGP